jgi:hypothetical protein
MAKDDYEGHTDFFKLDKNGSDTDSSFDFDDLNLSLNLLIKVISIKVDQYVNTT